MRTIFAIVFAGIIATSVMLTAQTPGPIARFTATTSNVSGAGDCSPIRSSEMVDRCRPRSTGIGLDSSESRRRLAPVPAAAPPLPAVAPVAPVGNDAAPPPAAAGGGARGGAAGGGRGGGAREPALPQGTVVGAEVEPLRLRPGGSS